MGQGTYGAIGFGCVLTAEQRASLFTEDGGRKFKVRDRPSTPYESDVDYVAYLIFDSSGYTNAGHDKRYAVSLSRLAEDTRVRYPKEYKAAEKKWVAFVAAAALLGVTLPAGEFIYVHDYD